MARITLCCVQPGLAGRTSQSGNYNFVVDVVLLCLIFAGCFEIVRETYS